MAGSEPQPRAFALLLRREKRLEDMLLDALIHPHAGIVDGYHDILAGNHVRMVARILRVQIDVGGFEGEFASLWHGIAGVDAEIDQDLLDLPGIHFDSPEAGKGESDEFHIFANEAAERSWRNSLKSSISSRKAVSTNRVNWKH